MWLVDLEGVWDGRTADDVRGADLAVRLIDRTKELLGRGSTWEMKPLARDASEATCDPLSGEARTFSLSGAAARARWELREDVAEAEINPVHVRQVMDALFSLARTYRGERGGWIFVEAVLDGMRNALAEYRGLRATALQHEKAALTGTIDSADQALRV
jgi:hypothetical protein